MNLFLAAALALIAGLLFTRVTNLLRLPDVTAYLIAGVLIGPYCLGLLHIPGLGFGSTAEVEGLSFISNTALGFIAFSIGSEFRLSDLKQTGKQALVIGVLQALVTCAVVDVALLAARLFLGDTLSPAG